ncbi:MAG: hypothetical protein EBW21_03525 [Actinobacteria bacterium]|nr:hypothetical protein [Actinomycetota bacterium]
MIDYEDSGECWGLQIRFGVLFSTWKGWDRLFAECLRRFQDISGFLPDTRIAAVTVLTSLSQEEVDALGFAASIPNLVNSLAHRSVDSGATAIVCSPWEVSTLRASLPSEISLITPGVRPHNSGTDDQSRTMTPFEAHKAGADFLVIGRPITAASDPGEAAASILATLV